MGFHNFVIAHTETEIKPSGIIREVFSYGEENQNYYL